MDLLLLLLLLLSKLKQYNNITPATFKSNTVSLDTIVKTGHKSNK
jgi:hypothetical protein